MLNHFSATDKVFGLVEALGCLPGTALCVTCYEGTVLSTLQQCPHRSHSSDQPMTAVDMGCTQCTLPFCKLGLLFVSLWKKEPSRKVLSVCSKLLAVMFQSCRLSLVAPSCSDLPCLKC